MVTHGACLECLVAQVLRTARLCGETGSLEKEIVDPAREILSGMNREATPVEAAIKLNRMLEKRLGNPDPYKAIKEESNRAMMELVGSLERLKRGNFSIREAMRYAIAGNSIDYGAAHAVDHDKVNHIAMEHPMAIDDSVKLEVALGSARQVSYLLDNAGEIVFDRLLIEAIERKYAPEKILVVVRDQPFINDALMEDAITVGLDRIPGVELASMFPSVPNGRGYVPKTWDAILSSDVVISKGQANFETFNEVEGFFFLFLVKCPVVAHEINRQSGISARVGDMVAWQGPRVNNSVCNGVRKFVNNKT